VSERTTTQSSETKWRLSRRQMILLLGLLVINVGIYGAMWLLKPANTANRPPTTSLVSEDIQLGGAYKQALALALGWQADVQLSNVATSWQVANGERLSLHRSAWSFQFYSPSVGQVKLVTVDGKGAHAGPLRPVGTAPQQVFPDWTVDSDDLLLTFMSYGGRDFMSAHPGANVHLQLKGNDEGRSVWYVTAVDPLARESLLVGMDARTRQVVSVK
jgi:hypothetical protein